MMKLYEITEPNGIDSLKLTEQQAGNLKPMRHKFLSRSRRLPFDICLNVKYLDIKVLKKEGNP